MTALSTKFRLTLLLSLLLAATTVHAKVASYFSAGPFTTPLPAWNASNDVLGGTFKVSDLLKHPHANTSDMWPTDGASFRAFGQSVKFRTMNADQSIGSATSTLPQVAWLAFFIETDRFDEITVEVSSPAMVEVTVNGKSILTKANSDTTSKSGDISLPKGKYVVWIKTVADAGQTAPWTVKTTVTGANHEPRTSLNPDRYMNIRLLLEEPTVSSVSLSHDAILAAVSISKPGESWIEIIRVSDAKPVRTYRGAMSFSGLQWAPDSRRFAYVERTSGTGTIWLVDIENGTTTELAKGISRLGSIRWANDGKRLFFTTSEQPTASTDGFKRLEHPNDRWPTYRHRNHISELSLDGTQRRLTWGSESVNLLDEHPAGDRLLVSRSRDDFSARPYSITEIGTLNLADNSYDSLFSARGVGATRFSPDGRQLLISGSATAFDHAGNTLAEDVIPNEYDTQLYIRTLADGSMKPITRTFNPSVGSAFWSPDGQSIFISTADKAYGNLYRFDVRRNTFSLLNTSVDMTSGVSISRNGTMLAYTGNGVNLPTKAYLMDVARFRSRVLADPNASTYSSVRYGDIQPWIFKNKDGLDIDGHVYYPTNFDPAKSYPVIVYYYAGTTPVTRDFGGRYPKEVWAANGYIVYVMQPSGAIGYGQEFSAAHVNNWGITVADEIIKGTNEFLAAHPFADKAKVGAIGASYGGFMTMLLQTRTDIFAAAVSHAGISNITSYWGEGYWGYGYSSIATAESFPWNRRDIYVDQSPIFFADKVNTPLLLLHGAGDTNVPLGESWQFYTALKLLGKYVELIEVADQDHHILNHPKRIKWSETIIAWFDRHLKDQPEWWEEMY